VLEDVGVRIGETSVPLARTQDDSAAGALR
jgi:hypothetical protein